MTAEKLHGDEFSLVGPTAVRSLEEMLINTVFIGTVFIGPDGVDAQWSLSCLNSACLPIGRCLAGAGSCPAAAHRDRIEDM